MQRPVMKAYSSMIRQQESGQWLFSGSVKWYVGFQDNLLEQNRLL